MAESLDENKLNLIWVIIEHYVMNQPIQDQQRALWKWWFVNRRHKRQPVQRSLHRVLNNIRKRSLPGQPVWQHSLSLGLKPLLPSARPASCKREFKYSVIYTMILTGRVNIEQRAFWRWLIAARLSKLAQRKGVKYREPVESSISKLSLSESINHTISNLQTSQDELYPYISTEASERAQHISTLSNSSLLTDRVPYGFDSASDLFNHDLMHLIVPAVKSSRLNLSLDAQSANLYQIRNTRPKTDRVRLDIPKPSERQRYLRYKSCSESEEDSFEDYRQVDEATETEPNPDSLKPGQRDFIRDLANVAENFEKEEEFAVFPLRYVLKPVKKPSLDVSVFTKSEEIPRKGIPYEKFYAGLRLSDTADITRYNISRVESPEPKNIELVLSRDSAFSVERYERVVKPVVDLKRSSYNFIDEMGYQKVSKISKPEIELLQAKEENLKSTPTQTLPRTLNIYYDLNSLSALRKPISDIFTKSDLITITSKPSLVKLTKSTLRSSRYIKPELASSDIETQTYPSIHTIFSETGLSFQPSKLEHRVLTKPVFDLIKLEGTKSFLKSNSISSTTTHFESPRLLSIENKVISSILKPAIEPKTVLVEDIIKNIQLQLQLLSSLKDRSYIEEIGSYLDILRDGKDMKVCEAEKWSVRPDRKECNIERKPVVDMKEARQRTERTGLVEISARREFLIMKKPKIDIGIRIVQSQQAYSRYATETLSKPAQNIELHEKRPVSRSSFSTLHRTLRYKDAISAADSSDISYLEAIQAFSKHISLSQSSSISLSVLTTTHSPILKPRCTPINLLSSSTYISNSISHYSIINKPALDLNSITKCTSNTSILQYTPFSSSPLIKPTIDISPSLSKSRPKVTQSLSITSPVICSISSSTLFPLKKPISDLALTSENLYTKKVTSISTTHRKLLRSHRTVPAEDSQILTKGQNSFISQRVHDLFYVPFNENIVVSEQEISSPMLSCRSSPVLSPLASPEELTPVMNVYKGVLSWVSGSRAKIQGQAEISVKELSVISKPVLDIYNVEASSKSLRIKEMFRSKISSIDSILKIQTPRPKSESFDAGKSQIAAKMREAKLSISEMSKSVSTSNLPISTHKPKPASKLSYSIQNQLSSSINLFNISPISKPNTDLRKFSSNKLQPAKDCVISLYSDSVFTRALKKPIIDISCTTPLDLMEIVKSAYGKVMSSRRELYTINMQPATYIHSISPITKPSQALFNLLKFTSQSSISYSSHHAFSKPISDMVRMPQDASFLQQEMSDSPGVSLNSSISYILSASVTPNSIESLHSVIKPKLESFLHVPVRNSETQVLMPLIKEVESSRVTLQKITAVVKPVIDIKIEQKARRMSISKVTRTVRSVKYGEIWEGNKEEESQTEMSEEFVQEKIADLSFFNTHALQKPHEEISNFQPEPCSESAFRLPSQHLSRFDTFTSYPQSYDNLAHPSSELLSEPQSNISLQTYSALLKPSLAISVESPIKELHGPSNPPEPIPIFSFSRVQTTHKQEFENSPYFYTTPRFCSSNSSAFSTSQDRLSPACIKKKVLDLSLETDCKAFQPLRKPMIDLYTHRSQPRDVCTITKTRVFIKHVRNQKVFNLERSPRFSISSSEKHLEALQKPRLDMISTFKPSNLLTSSSKLSALIKPSIHPRAHKALRSETQPLIEPPILHGESLKNKEYCIRIGYAEKPYARTPTQSKEEQVQTVSPIKLLPPDELNSKVILIQKHIRGFLAKRLRYRKEHDISMQSFRSSTSSIDLSTRPRSVSPVLSNLNLLKVASRFITRHSRHKKLRRRLYEPSFSSKPRYYPIQRATKAIIRIFLLRVQDSFDMLKLNDLAFSSRSLNTSMYSHKTPKKAMSSQATFLEDSSQNYNLTRANLSDMHRLDIPKSEFLASPSSISLQDESDWFISRPLTPFEYVYSIPYDDLEKKVVIIQRNIRKFMNKRRARRSGESDSSAKYVISSQDLFQRISSKLQERNLRLTQARQQYESQRYLDSKLNRVSVGIDRLAHLLSSRLSFYLKSLRKLGPKLKHSALLPPTKPVSKLRKPRKRTQKPMSHNESLVLSPRSISKDQFSTETSRVSYSETMKEILVPVPDLDYLTKILKIQRAFRRYLAIKWSQPVYIRKDSGEVSVQKFNIPQIPLDVLLMKVILLQKAIRRFLAIKHRSKLHDKLKRSILSSGSSTPTSRRRSNSGFRSPKTASKLEALRQLSISRREQLLGHSRVKSEIVGLGRKKFYSIQKAVKCLNRVVLADYKWSFGKLKCEKGEEKED
jgi:hypothetical protein